MSGSRLSEIYERHQVLAARETLAAFVIQQALTTADEIGFTWKPTPDAPERFDVLSAAYHHSEATGEPLPISSANNDSTIYTSAEANIAFRFCHDVHHVRLGLSFDLVDELKLALWHLDALEHSGFPPTSLPWRLLHADLIGQATVMAFARRFPLDQYRFAEGCLTGRFDRGLLAELRREPGGGSDGEH
jgi:hypothetical protein